MLYKNEKTGAVIDTTCKLGGAWKPVKAEEPKPEKKAPAKKAVKKSTVKK